MSNPTVLFRAYVFNTQAAATQAQTTVDAALGLPKAGVDVGGGIHASAAESATTTYFTPWQHPTLQQWAYLSDATTDAILVGKVAVVSTPLGADWLGSTPVATVGQAGLSTFTRRAVAFGLAAALAIGAAVGLSLLPKTPNSSPVDAGAPDAPTEVSE